IALGVTVFTAIQVVNHSALQSFRASIDVVAGKANFTIEGDGLRLPEDLYLLARSQPGVLAATPVLQEVALLPDHPGSYLHILGIDLFSNRPFSTFVLLDQQFQPASILDFLTRPDHIAISESLARRLNLRVGDSLTVLARGTPIRLTIAALLRFSEDTPGADPHLALMDIASVQETFDLLGKIDRLDLLLDASPAQLPAAVATLRDRLSPLLPPHARSGSPERRSAQVETMLGAFQLNLTALSLISLLVGTFLIYNTAAASVISRRPEIGLLRTLGVQPWQIQVLFLFESASLGLIGAVLGIMGGGLLAAALVQTVSATITSLYILLHIQDILLTPGAMALALGFGLAAALAGAWWPAREASRVSVVEALSPGTLAESARTRIGRWTVIACLAFLLALATAIMALRTGPASISFGSALFTLLGFAFLVPALSHGVSRSVPLLLPIWARLAFGHFGRSLHRNSITIAAVVAALAMLLGVSIMIHSFRTTVDGWLNRTLAADFFVAPISVLALGARETLPLTVAETVEAWPMAERVGRYRELHTTVRDLPVKISATQIQNVADYDVLVLEQGTSAETIRAMRGQQQVLVSEPFRNRTGLGPGASVTFDTPTGQHTFTILDVFKDYTTDRGLVLIDLETYRTLWADPSLTSVAAFLRPGIDRETAYHDLRERLAPLGTFLTLSRAQLRSEAIRVFDQTFSVTYLLRLIAFIVAGLGIFLTMTILASEQKRLIGVLRAAGASRPQVAGMILTEALLIGSVGWVLGVAAGFALAAVLAYVINVAFFGWTIEWATPWPVVWQSPFWVLAVTLAAAIFPAWRAASADISEAVRSE
ncbi:MAG: FtsX-like permease family protein, partial [Verrucomicrobiia bacterium]